MSAGASVANSPSMGSSKKRRATRALFESRSGSAGNPLERVALEAAMGEEREAERAQHGGRHPVGAEPHQAAVSR